MIYHYGKHEMWVPYDAFAKVLEKYRIDPELGSSECGFEAFCEYLCLLPSSRYLGRNGDDIDSLVGIFDHDLKTFDKIEKLKNKEKRNATQSR